MNSSFTAEPSSTKDSTGTRPRGPVSETRGLHHLPELSSQGAAVNAKDHVAGSTILWVACGYVVVAILAIVSVVASVGAVIPVALIGWAAAYYTHQRVYARLRGSHLQVSSQQLREVHECASGFAARLGITKPFDIYVVESNVLNAAAYRLFTRRALLLSDDIVWGAVRAECPQALRFIIAHELAHHALGHTGFLRSTLRASVRPLSRLDELSADRVALELVGDRDVAYDALVLLTAGPQLWPYVNRQALMQQSLEVGQNKLSKKGEAGLTHPLLLRRLFELRQVSRVGS